MIQRSYSTIRTSVEGPVATISLHRPEKRNAINSQMVNELLYAFSDAFDAPSVHCLVLAGEGSAFCVGGDFAEFVVPHHPPDALPARGDFADLLLVMMNARKPIVARVHGQAFGGGLGLVAACTLAVASADASFGTPEIKVGVFPMMIMAVLARVVPRRHLLEMALLGERFPADHALRIGLLNRVVPSDALDNEVRALAAAISEKSASTIRLGLEAFSAQQDSSLVAALPMLAVRLQDCLATDDAREGLMAFVDKRPPKWSGR